MRRSHAVPGIIPRAGTQTPRLEENRSQEAFFVDTCRTELNIAWGWSVEILAGDLPIAQVQPNLTFIAV